MAGKAKRPAQRGGADGTFQVVLQHGRSRHIGWLLFGGAAGSLLVWKLGAVGKGVGLVLLVVAALHLFRLARTLLRPAGLIDLADDGVALPAELCSSSVLTIPYDQVHHAFFLRRAVPWTRTGPILVIETAERVFWFPRDWFASDSDQRRVATALNRRLGRLG